MSSNTSINTMLNDEWIKIIIIISPTTSIQIERARVYFSAVDTEVRMANVYFLVENRAKMGSRRLGYAKYSFCG